ncbi:MAG: sugar phosphate isomerase/epimerase [Candidatus Nephthysia bennettiae]|nr:MAG: sugar phosphate isomerase/epimerase [Candidatus Dormibacteraeota bacterium]
MQLGIFAKTFARPSVEETLEAVAGAGLPAAQFNLSVLGLPTLPHAVPAEAIAATREAAARTGVGLAAISGAFNTAHPDPAVRKAGVARFPVLCEAASALDIPLITLSSGTRDPDDMWRYHPDNSSSAAWSDSRDSLAALAAIASEHGLKLAVEPEHTNVLATAALARRMLDEVGSPALGVVFDATNLIDPDQSTPDGTLSVITDAARLLGPDIVLGHAKELTSRRRPVPAGDGILPWDAIVDALDRAGFTGTLVIHGLSEADVGRAVRTLQGVLRDKHRT